MPKLPKNDRFHTAWPPKEAVTGIKYNPAEGWFQTKYVFAFGISLLFPSLDGFIWVEFLSLILVLGIHESYVSNFLHKAPQVLEEEQFFLFL